MNTTVHYRCSGHGRFWMWVEDPKLAPKIRKCPWCDEECGKERAS